MNFSDKTMITRRLSAVVALLIAPSFAAAQDTFDWTGFYMGAQLGGGTFGVEASDLTDTITNDAPKIQDLSPAYGIVAGYNWAPLGENFIIGVEVDGTFGLEANKLLGFNDEGTDGLEFLNTWENVVSLRARAGIVSGRSLMFVAAGPAFATTNFTFKDLDPSSDDCDTLVCAKAQNSKLCTTQCLRPKRAF
jgi:hypothetical protein